MSPQNVRNQFLYDESSRFLQDWHRRTFGPSAEAIDLDLIGTCHRCHTPLYGIEATTNPDKATTILRLICRSLGIPAILWRHDRTCSEIVRVTRLQLNGEAPLSGDEEFAKDLIGSIREAHRCGGLV